MNAAHNTGKIDMKHGFMKSIIRNQVDRDNYDKQVNDFKTTHKKSHLLPHENRPKKPNQAVYIPPWRKNAAAAESYKQTNESSQENQQSKEPSHAQGTKESSHFQELLHTQEMEESSEEEVDQGPRTLFCYEFEDKDGQKYKQYVKEGVRAELLAQRMGDHCRLTPPMIKALEQRLQEEIDKRTTKKGS